MKLSTKLALLFAAIAALPVLATFPFVLQAVQEAFEDEYEARLAAAGRAMEAERQALDGEVLRSLDAIAASEAVETVLEGLGQDPDPAVHVAVAERLMVARGLDVLELLDEEGRVLSSGHLPARAGDPDPAGRALSTSRPGKAVAAWVEARTERGISRRLAVVAARPVARGRQRVHVLAGKLLAEPFARRLAGTSGASIALVEAGSGAVIAAAATGEAGRRPGAVEQAALALVAPPRDRLRSLPIADDAGKPLAELRATVSTRSLERAQARILGASALLLLAGVTFAALAGVLLARRIVRPVEALAAGAATVATGNLDHRVEARAGAELGALVTSFNQMTADLKREKERAAVAERVAAWREVARRLAHEIKNPLTPIAMSIETLRDAYAAGSPQLPELFEGSSRTILEEVARLKKIVDEFSRFARLPPPERTAQDLSELATSVLGLYPSMPSGIALRRELPPGLPSVLADRDQVTQVLLNLIQNSEQALALAGRGGTVTVRARSVPGAVVLEVADDGPGIPAEHLERVFEPYFTTKDTGTGLGLAIARRIAEEHGGTLEVESRPGAGATFRLRVPVAA